MDTGKTFTVEEAQRALENYCAYQERCHKEVREKLMGMRMIPEAVDHIITHLIQENYLNEERFAKAFARGKFRIKKWGRNRIIRELKFRDISKFNIDTALKEISPQAYHETLHELAVKKADGIREINLWKKKKKLADYLLYRGWESHLVYEKVSELIS
ncbi:RecX family transcriptional regulator [Mangrovimonas sp. AS39]|uniref:regulatory protein RecX n=1 Tax=Mangrovimonas futianensis TaxID=2895523 RepID=UPI001E365D55|nr:regulatory protein RecX [Mangrovimonas futianensis]MCF1190514.1 RecX family transcriptional regulator [Mangrovimonas futianensis]MCF1193734.1 RecX family transcriptional regulator [Mangrovimonas futianensis]